MAAFLGHPGPINDDACRGRQGGRQAGKCGMNRSAMRVGVPLPSPSFPPSLDAATAAAHNGKFPPCLDSSEVDFSPLPIRLSSFLLPPMKEKKGKISRISGAGAVVRFSDMYGPPFLSLLALTSVLYRLRQSSAKLR